MGVTFTVKLLATAWWVSLVMFGFSFCWGILSGLAAANPNRPASARDDARRGESFWSAVATVSIVALLVSSVAIVPAWLWARP